MLTNAQSESLVEWLKAAKGAQVKEVLTVEFVHPDEPSRKPILAWFELSNNHSAGVGCAANGSALEISHEYPMEYEMGEYGKTELRKHKLRSHEEGDNRIDEAMVIFDESQPVALRIGLFNGEEITLANVGDELTFVEGHHPMFDELQSDWQVI